MRVRVDKENDSLYFRLDESRIVESEEVQPGVILDYDENDQVVGVEFLSETTPSTPLIAFGFFLALNKIDE